MIKQAMALFSLLSLNNSTFQSKTIMLDVSLYNHLIIIEDGIHYVSMPYILLGLLEEDILVFIDKKKKEVPCGSCICLNAPNQKEAQQLNPQKFKLGGIV